MLRGHAPILVSLLVLGWVYVWLNWLDELGSLHGDGLIYFLMAIEYAPYWPEDSLAKAVAGTTQFPPVYSFLLMLGGGGASFLAAHVATTVFLVASFAAFYVWLTALGIGRLRACAGAVLFAMLPGTFLQSFYLHPEGLYIALVFAAFAWLEAGERSLRPGYFWCASVAIALAFVTRTAGVTLLPGLAIVLLRYRPRGWIAMVVLPVIPAAAWSIWHRPAMSYTEALVSKYGSGASLEAIIEDVAGLVVQVAEGLGWNVVQSEGLLATGILLGCIAAVVALGRFAHGKADAWYLVAYLGVLAVWPYPQEAWRLTWVVVPILLGYLLLAGEFLYARAGALAEGLRSAVRLMPIVALVLLVVPGFTLSMTRAVHAVMLGEPELRHVPQWYEPDGPGARLLARSQFETVQALREFARLIPEGECVFSSSPLVTAYFTDRNVSFTPRDYRDDRAFDDEIARSGCRYFVMLGIRTRYKAPFYPRDRLARRLQIVAEHRMGGEHAGGPVVAMLGVLKT